RDCTAAAERLRCRSGDEAMAATAMALPARPAQRSRSTARPAVPPSRTRMTSPASSGTPTPPPWGPPAPLAGIAAGLLVAPLVVVPASPPMASAGKGVSSGVAVAVGAGRGVAVGGMLTCPAELVKLKVGPGAGVAVGT